jgi:hypothetical protein
VACNSCWGTIIQGLPLACDNNPRVAHPHELDADLPAATSPKRIAVVGAGIAGLEAAMTAAQRGHQVTLWGHGAMPGGKAQLQSRLPISESLSSIADYQFMELKRLGVDLRLGQQASVQDVMAMQPQAVVLATGATMVWPQALPIRLRDDGWVKDLREVVVDLPAWLWFTTWTRRPVPTPPPNYSKTGSNAWSSCAAGNRWRRTCRW